MQRLRCWQGVAAGEGKGILTEAREAGTSWLSLGMLWMYRELKTMSSGD